jgi:hypothetical protein
MFPRGVDDCVMLAVVVADAETCRGAKDGGARGESTAGDEAMFTGDAGESGKGSRESAILARAVGGVK